MTILVQVPTRAPRPTDSDLAAGAANVLLVDDNCDTALRLSNAVTALGHRVRVATTWTEALRAFDPAVVDIVLMDAVMPTVDGFKLTRLLRAREQRFVPIVFVTSLHDAAARRLGVKVGADDFLTKPVDSAELQVRLAAMLRIRRLTIDLETRSEELARLANYDQLTGLRNRRSFDGCLREELQRGHRLGRQLSLLLLDVDRFKRINDTYGHVAGDAVLAFLGDLLRGTTRAGDLVYRLGGEEFAVIVPQADTSEATRLAERIRAAVASESGSATSAGAQTISVGVAGTDLWRHRILPTTLVYGADTALYCAKRGGRDRVCVYAQEKRTEESLDATPLPR